MNRRAGGFAALALLGILMLAGTALLGGITDPGPTPLAVATQAASPPPARPAAPTPAASATGTPPRSSTAAMPSDFNGDGYADLVIGFPGRDFGERFNAGGVQVLYGSIEGLTAAGNQLWSRDSPDVLGTAETSDGFGAAVASGDFDGDGFADLAVGALGGSTAGGVNVLFGSPAGLTTAENELWSVEDLPGAPGDVAGVAGLVRALVSGDFDGDGFADLAIGLPGVGALALLHGSAQGLEFRGVWLSRALTGAPYQLKASSTLGSVLAAGDLNGDGRDDLAAASGAHPGGRGEVSVFYGSGSGLTAVGSQLWSQDSSGVRGSTGNDEFGAALAIGDFDGDGFGELAVGVPGEGGCPRCFLGAGAVNVLRGSATGLTADGNQLWSERTPGVPGAYEEPDRFGRALAAGDFDGDGADDLAIGAPGEDPSPRSRPFGTGAVTVLYGSRDGLTTNRAQRWTQDSPGVPSTAQPGETFGASLSSAQFGGSSHDDLAIGVPSERLPPVGPIGMVNVLFGGSGGLDGDGAQALSKSRLGLSDALQTHWRGGMVLGH